MTFIDAAIQQLSARLPELSWKLNALGPVLQPTLFPRGLFCSRFELTPASCIDEINADLATIHAQTNEQAVHYLAERVVKKINVLVRICQQHSKQKKPDRQVALGVQAINTRQQWLKTMQSEIDLLSEQQKALAAALHVLKANGNVDAVLRVQAELGQAERRLTEAKEAYARSTR